MARALRGRIARYRELSSLACPRWDPERIRARRIKRPISGQALARGPSTESRGFALFHLGHISPSGE